MVTKKKWLVLMISLGIGIFSAFSFVFSENVEDVDDNVLATYYWWDVSLSQSILNLSNRLSSKPLADKRSIINTYCQALLSDEVFGGKFLFSGNQVNFNSKNSLFVRWLCRAWERRDEHGALMDGSVSLVDDALINGVFQDHFVKQLKLQQMDGMKDVCLEPSAERCDILRYASKVYTSLMSDVFKIKWAHFLQVYSIKGAVADKYERVANVFKVFFATQESNKGDYFLFYPKTAAMIDNNQQFFMKSLQSLVMLDNDELLEKAVEAGCVPPLDGQVGGFVCGLHMPNQQGMDQYFVNFVMNEYLHYRFFIDFYANQQQKRILGNSNLSSLDSAQRRSLMTIVNSLVAQRDMDEEVLRRSLEDFQDFIATYPLHLGFVWYQEQLLKFRNDYATKMVTPFYSLYEKLRNVQPPE